MTAFRAVVVSTMIMVVHLVEGFIKVAKDSFFRILAATRPVVVLIKVGDDMKSSIEGV